MASTAQKALFSGVVFVGFFALAEVGARLAPDEMRRTRDQLILDHAREPGLLSPNTDVPGWDLVDGGVQDGMEYNVNDWRMRGPDYAAEAPADAVRVAFVGDSSVFGVQLEWERTFTHQFKVQRERRFPEVEYQVANCASPGHSSYQSRIKLERHCLGFEPDIVVIGNQFSDSTMERAEDVVRFPKEEHPELIRRLESFSLFRLSNQIWWKRVGSQVHNPQVIVQHGMEQTGETERVSLDDYAMNLGAMVDLVRAAGSEPVFMVLAAYADTTFHHTGDKVVSRLYRERMRDVADAKDVPLVDFSAHIRARYPGQHTLFLDPVHPSASGALLYAQILDQELPMPTPGGGAL